MKGKTQTQIQNFINPQIKEKEEVGEVKAEDWRKFRMSKWLAETVFKDKSEVTTEELQKALASLPFKRAQEPDAVQRLERKGYIIRTPNGTWRLAREEEVVGEKISEARAEVKTEEAVEGTMGFELEDFIPKDVPPYVPRKIGGMKDIEILEKAWNHNPPKNVLLVGPTGTGKTHAVRALAQKLGVPYVRVNLNRAITPEDLVGQWVPSNGHFVWADGLLTKFVRHGGIFVADEINAAPPEILFVLHQLLDDERKLVLTQKDGEVVKAHPRFMFVATMNPSDEFGYEGTTNLNQAFLDRFQVILRYDYDNKVESKLGIDGEVAELAQKLRSRPKEITTPVSTRLLLNFVDNIRDFGPEVAKEIFKSRFAGIEKKVVEELLALLNFDKKEGTDERGG